MRVLKKLLGILVLGLLFISIDLSNPTTIAAADEVDEILEMLEKKKMEKMGFFEKQKYKYKKHKRRKKYCADEASYAKTDFAAKKIYKACMSN